MIDKIDETSRMWWSCDLVSVSQILIREKGKNNCN